MAIQVKNLLYSYTKGVNALENVNLSFEEGSFTALIGETGSGKSTLVQNLGLDVTNKCALDFFHLGKF